MMADVVDKATRSRMMAGIKDKDTQPELIVRKYLHSQGIRYRLHRSDLPGKPDLVFPRFGCVVFVHGCFWHRHKGCSYAATPKSRQEFWAHKFGSNIERDRRNNKQLRRLGWHVLVIWECQTDDLHLHRLYKAIVSPRN